MVNYYIERTLQAFFTVFAVITATFGLIRLMPGGPIDYVRAQLMQQGTGEISQEAINRQVEIYTNVQPDEPLYIQYIDYMSSVLTGDFGTSMYYNGQEVTGIIAAALPWTVFVMAVSLALTFVLGVALGAIMAYKEGSQFDTASTIISIILNSIPYYIAAVILLYALGYQGSWFPISGRVGSNTTPGTLEFYTSAVYHAILPIFSMVITGFGIQALSMRGNSIRTLGEDYLRVARLRGLPTHVIAFRYVGRNAILPMYTGLMISIGFMFGGSVILEEIFSYQGLGYYMFVSIDARDYPLMMGSFLVITIAVVLGVYIADLTYGKIDPRASSGGGSREAY